MPPARSVGSSPYYILFKKTWMVGSVSPEIVVHEALAMNTPGMAITDSGCRTAVAGEV